MQRRFWSRFIRHVIPVAISLAIIGYLLAHAFLLSHRMYAGGAYSESNERVLWQTPVVMAALGILMTFGLDLLAEVFRKRAPVPVTAPPATDAKK
jgi:uncharacterized membrane protein YhhN